MKELFYKTTKLVTIATASAVSYYLSYQFGKGFAEGVLLALREPEKDEKIEQCVNNIAEIMAKEKCLNRCMVVTMPQYIDEEIYKQAMIHVDDHMGKDRQHTAEIFKQEMGKLRELQKTNPNALKYAEQLITERAWQDSLARVPSDKVAQQNSNNEIMR